MDADMTSLQNVRDFNPDIRTVYTSGSAEVDNSWRLTSPEPNGPNSTHRTQRREPLTETNIDLTEAKITSVEAFGYTPTNRYAASVLTDNRTNKLFPDGIFGDMTGRVISFDGTFWRNSPDEWFTRDTRTSNNTSFNVPVEFLSINDMPQFILDTQPPQFVGGNSIPRVNFTDVAQIIKWGRDWVGEGRVVQTLDQACYPPLVGGRIPVTRFRHFKNSDNVDIIDGFEMPPNGPVEWSSENENNNDIRAQIGADVLINGTNSPGLIIRNLAFEDRDGNIADFINLIQAGSETFSKVILENVTLIDFKELGTFDGFQSVEINSCRLALYDKGFTFKNVENLRMSNNLFLGLNESGAVDVTIEGTNGNIIINGTIWSSDDNAIAMDVKSTSTIDQGTVGPSTYKEPTGGQFFAAGSLDTEAVGWDYQNNGTLRNSNAIADFSASGNVAETIISTINTPVPINIAATGVPGNDERFTVNADGSITYIGTRPENCQILLNTSIDVTPALEDAQTQMTVHIFKDPAGASPAASIKSQKKLIASAFATPTPIDYFLSVSELLEFGDVIQGYVENNTGTLNPVHSTLEESVRK